VEYRLRVFPTGPDTEPYHVDCASREQAWALGSSLRAGTWQVMRLVEEPDRLTPEEVERLLRIRLVLDADSASEDNGP
jgi:hypothetical protein